LDTVKIEIQRHIFVIMKYEISDNQGEILPNLLGLKTSDEIGVSEFEGFLTAEIFLTEKLTTKTKFTEKYIKQIHKKALGHLYSFAGKYRDVNMSKGGFPFAAAKFLPETMAQFDNEILSILPSSYSNKEDLIKDIAIIHAELLFIHPFREGNGRTARLLANLMSRKNGFGSLRFEEIDYDKYISAVQEAAMKKYSKMIDLITTIFPD
jgi:cell filamentation protein